MPRTNPKKNQTKWNSNPCMSWVARPKRLKKYQTKDQQKQICLSHSLKLKKNQACSQVTANLIVEMKVKTKEEKKPEY